MEIKNQIKDLLKEVKENENRQYSLDWKQQAVNALNDYYEETGYYDDKIYNLESEEWNDIVRYNLDSRGWLGVKILLEDIDSQADYARLDAYGNGRSVDYDLVEMLKSALDE